MANIKMDFDMMAEMKALCQKGAEETDSATEQIKKIVGMLEEGALIGDAGTSLASGMNDVLMRKMVEIRDKFEELGRDIQFAVNKMQEADSGSAEIMGM